MSEKPFFDEDQQAVLGLMTSLMDQNAKFTNNLTNSLMEGYQADTKRARAELRVVRLQVTELFADGYMPTESRIIDALIPDPELVEKIMEGRWF